MRKPFFCVLVDPLEKRMKQLILILLSTLSLTSLAQNPPRQKINLTGELLANAPKVMSITDMEKFQKPISITIFDPYNKNIETPFYGFYLSELVKAYARPDFKTLRVSAIDGYKIDIPKADIEKAQLFVTYRDKNGYLTVDRMGPARIIAPYKGVIKKDVLLKIGVNWVWQIKSFEFMK